MSLLPIDLTEMLHNQLRLGRREPDGMLHCSSDLLGSLRHTQLRMVLDTPPETELMSDIRLNTGTMWHDYFDKAFQSTGLPSMREVRVDPWLPEGWSGIADWLIWNPQLKAFVLGDLKTIKGEGMRFIRDSGAKEEHIWQVSAYYHALVGANIPLADNFIIYYLPMNLVPRDDDVQPLVCECKPIDLDIIEQVMNEKSRRVKAFIQEFENIGVGFTTETILNNPELEPPMERVQSLTWNGKMNVFDVKLGPHWTARYCPFDLQFCNCSQQQTEKIGHYTLLGEYVPRRGYASIVPTVEPTPRDYNRRK